VSSLGAPRVVREGGKKGTGRVSIVEKWKAEREAVKGRSISKDLPQLVLGIRPLKERGPCRHFCSVGGRKVRMSVWENTTKREMNR